VDTVVTHLAAAINAPTIALFGPTYTRYWAPWPYGCCEDSPFEPNRGVQRVANVTIVQQDWECVPCNRELCAVSDRGVMECMEQLSVTQVYDELAAVLKATD
jgi:heptosyltransferase-3